MPLWHRRRPPAASAAAAARVVLAAALVAAGGVHGGSTAVARTAAEFMAAFTDPSVSTLVLGSVIRLGQSPWLKGLPGGQPPPYRLTRNLTVTSGDAALWQTLDFDYLQSALHIEYGVALTFLYVDLLNTRYGPG